MVFGFAARASSTAAGDTALPHSASTLTTLASQRSAISAIREAKNPATPTMMVSPGSRELYSAASMPADPVPEMGRVRPLPVWKTSRRSSTVSSMMAQKSGSMWESTGPDIEA